MAAQCACCGRELPGSIPEPPDPDTEYWDQRCVELRSAGARWARELEDDDLFEWVDAVRQHGPGVIEVRPT